MEIVEQHFGSHGGGLINIHMNISLLSEQKKITVTMFFCRNLCVLLTSRLEIINAQSHNSEWGRHIFNDTILIQ